MYREHVQIAFKKFPCIEFIIILAHIDFLFRQNNFTKLISFSIKWRLGNPGANNPDASESDQNFLGNIFLKNI